MTGLRTAFAAIVSAVLVATPALAGQFSADQTTEIGTIVKNYLMAHPEVIRDAIVALDAKDKEAEAAKQQKAIADLSAPDSHLYGGSDSFVVGNPEGKITLVEFFDYNCGYCKRSIEDIDRLMKDNKDLRVILKDFPILSPNSVDASIAAGAVHRQFQGEKFWQFHRALLGQRGLVGKEQALTLAKSMGADMDKLSKDMADPSVRKGIEQSDTVAKSLSLNGTPSFILGDNVLVGAVGYDEINKNVQNVRKCGKALCS